MVKCLLSCFVCATILLGGNMENKTIQKCLTSSNRTEVIIDGKYDEITNIGELNQILKKMLNNSRTMPAFGVSIHNETIEAMKSGVWLRLIYENETWVDGMNFDELLININPTFSGFNIIRGNNGIYEGRCYYIDLVDNTMKALYEYLNKGFD